MKGQLLGLLLICVMADRTLAIEPISVADTGNPNAPTVASLVNNILDEGSAITIFSTVNAANSTHINNPSSSNTTSDPLMTAAFTHGNTVSENELGGQQTGQSIIGKPLPGANQNGANNATYAGGIAIEEGIVLCNLRCSRAAVGVWKDRTTASP